MAVIVRVYTELKDVVTLVRLLKISTHEAGTSPCCTRRTTVLQVLERSFTRLLLWPWLFLGKLAATLRTPSTVALMHMEVLGDTSASCHAGRGQYQKCEIALPVPRPSGRACWLYRGSINYHDLP